MRTSLLNMMGRLTAGCIVSIMLLHGCSINPVSGERQLMLVSEEQEVAMGAAGAKDVANTIGLVDNLELQNYVQRLGLQLAADSERPNLPWSFRVIDDPTPNAFAFPGGYIFITRGLMGLMGNEAELVTVLGHEIGHVTARHSASMMSRAQVAQIGLGVGSILSPQLAQFSNLASGGLSLLFLSYGRDAERQADDLGFRYALNHGYDVREMVNVFASLQHAGELAGASSLPHWLSSHPNPEQRIKRINDQLADLDQPLKDSRIGLDDYMNQIDGMDYGVNPRQGYFEDNRFLHPDMAFQITFPKGWQTQNLASIVQAGSPQQDAVIQMTVAAGSPTEAANQFFAQQGLSAGRVAEHSINGLRAVVGHFAADTQNGRVGGLAAFILYNNMTFQVLAFTPEEKLGSYNNTFLAAINSFARLTDRTALEKQADRISIVQTTQPMTLSAFNQRYPSVVDIKILALINQISAPAAIIPARTRMKRIMSGK
ncbi:MAG: M48 family metalloprotease [Gammaproteobacteria bacterium]